jgi:hypothetical protein
MTDWPVLDVALGLALVYTSASLLCSSLNEAIASSLGLRATFLEKWLLKVVSNPGASKTEAGEALAQFYRHPLIEPLVGAALPGTARKRRPSYIPASTFVSALLSREPGADGATPSLDTIVAALPADTKRAVMILRQEVGGQEAALRKRLEAWYDQSMDRVSGWYKRRVQVFLAVIGLIAASLLNIDSIHIADALWSQASVRSAVVAKATNVAAQEKAPTQGSLADTAKDLNSLNAIGLPIGWQFKKGDARDLPHTRSAWAAKIAGILITTLALLLGAPFWFDLLSQVAGLRGAGPIPTAAGRSDPGAPRGP